MLCENPKFDLTKSKNVLLYKLVIIRIISTITQKLFNKWGFIEWWIFNANPVNGFYDYYYNP